MTDTLLRARWVVGWDGAEHRLIRNGVVVWRDDTILHVGRSWADPVDAVIEAPGGLVVPGLISTHAHVGSHAGDRLVLDGGRHDFQRSGFLNYVPRRAAEAPGLLEREDGEAAIRFGLAALLRGGVTTVVEMGGGDPAAMTRLAGESGIRLYYGPVFNGGDYRFEPDGRLVRVPDQAGGLAALQRAEQVIARIDGAHDGRVRGMLVLDEVFQATPALLRHTRQTAQRLRVGITAHCAEQVYEFHEIVRRTGATPVRWLAAEGFLGPELVLAHCVYVDGHSLTAYPWPGDLDALARSGTSVAHCPVALARRGVMLESFERYRAAGVTLSLGTDSFPLDLVEEMRWAALLGKVATRDHEAASARAVFDAATVGGARALGRDDLGRLAPGARADLVLFDFDRLRVGPVRDPIRALVYCATSDLVDRVIVAGRSVVEGGRVLAWDEAAVLRAVRASTAEVWRRFPAYHWSGRGAREVFPPALAPWRR